MFRILLIFAILFVSFNSYAEKNTNANKIKALMDLPYEKYEDLRNYNPYFVFVVEKDEYPEEEKYLEIYKRIQLLKELPKQKYKKLINTQVEDILTYDWEKAYGKDPLCFAYNITCDDDSLYFENVADCSRKYTDKHKLEHIKYISPEGNRLRDHIWDEEKKYDYEKNKDNNFTTNNRNRGSWIADGVIKSKTCSFKGKNGEKHTITLELEPMFYNPTDEVASKLLPQKDYPVGAAFFKIKADGYGYLGEETGVYNEYLDPSYNYRKFYVRYKKDTDEFCSVFATRNKRHDDKPYCVKRKNLSKQCHKKSGACPVIW